MPIIPRGQENVRLNVSSPVPIAGTESARDSGEAIARFGSAVGKLGENLLQDDRRLKLEEATSQLQDVPKQVKSEISLLLAPDGSNYRMEFETKAQPKIDAIKNQYAKNDPWISKRLDSYITRARSDIDTMIGIEQASMLEKHNFDRLDKLGDESANRLRENPNPNLISAELRNQQALYSELKVTPENKMKLDNAYRERAANSLISGMEQRQEYRKALQYLQANQEDPNLVTKLDPDMAQTLGLIDGREASALKNQGKTYDVPVLTKGSKVKLSPEEGAIMSAMSPEKKAHKIDQMKSALKAQTEVRLSDLHQNINGFNKIALSGTPGLTEKNVSDLVKQINSSGMSGPAKVRMVDDVQTSFAINQQLLLANTVPRSQWDQVLTGVSAKVENMSRRSQGFDAKMALANTDYATQANRAEKNQILERALQSVAKVQEADAASYVVQSNPKLGTLFMGTKDGSPEGTRNYVQASLAQQQYIGIPSNKQRVLMKPEAEEFSQALKNMPSAQDTSNYINQLQGKYGEYFPRVMNEIAASDKKLADYRAVAYADPSTRTALVDAIKNEDQIKKAIKDDESLKTKSKMVDMKVNNVMGKFRLATLGSANDSGRLGVVNSLQNLVAIQARRDMVQNPDADPQTLAEKAYDDVVSSSYQISNGGRSSALVPNQVAGRPLNSRLIGTYMDVYSRSSNFKDLSIAVPTGDDPEKFYKALERNHRWVTNEDQTGIKLMQVDSAGGLQPVYDTMKKPVERNYEQIMLRPGEKVNNASKSTLQRIFGG